MTFEELLRASLEGANESFTRTEDDLFQEVAAAAQGIEHLTEGKATLTLFKAEESQIGVIYELHLGQRGAGQEVLAFLLKPTGYPIMAAADSGVFRLKGAPQQLRQIDDSQQLNKLFSELASDRSSRLVVGVAYLLRRERRKKDGDRPPDSTGTARKDEPAA